MIGIGPGGHFLYFPSADIRAAWEDSRFESVSVGEDCLVLTDPPEIEEALVEPVAVDNGECLVDLGLATSKGGPAVSIGNPVFNAYFRPTQTHYMSIADNGATVHGGLSDGDGSRGGSERWDFFGESPLEYFFTPAYFDRDARIQGLDPMFYMLVAQWSGLSVENFTGEESTGIVQVACVWRHADIEPGIVFRWLYESTQPSTALTTTAPPSGRSTPAPE